MRDLYKTFLKRGILPDAVAVQNPVLLFDALHDSSDGEQEIPNGMEWFYGD